jgi:signal peptidase I
MTSCQVQKAVPDPASPDRFWCWKVYEPRRWDIVVFQFPAEPTYTYVQRIVGLPGETVVINDGSVWINGRKLTAPGGQYYLSEVAGPPGGGALRMWGTKQSPAELGPDEYFMLGDFSENSSDSRICQDGAPGHPPYAVPRSHIIGVATYIYWPLERTGRLR